MTKVGIIRCRWPRLQAPCRGVCSIPSLETGLQAVWPSPYHAVSTPAEFWLWDDLALSEFQIWFRTRMRSRSRLAHPNICRLSILILFTWPSTGPEL